MSDESTIVGLALFVGVTLLALSFTAGAIWGTMRAERKARTPRIPVRPIDMTDLLERP